MQYISYDGKMAVFLSTHLVLNIVTLLFSQHIVVTNLELMQQN